MAWGLVLLLVLSVLLPYYAAIEAIASGGTPAPLPFTPEFFTNFLLSGGVWVSQFYRARP